MAANAIRQVVPLGVNICAPFTSISIASREASILPPARTVIEEETRRNVFWLAYAVERGLGSQNGWATLLDDEDITQMMPLSLSSFENGVGSFVNIECYFLNSRGRNLFHQIHVNGHTAGEFSWSI